MRHLTLLLPLALLACTPEGDLNVSSAERQAHGDIVKQTGDLKITNGTTKGTKHTLCDRIPCKEFGQSGGDPTIIPSDMRDSYGLPVAFDRFGDPMVTIFFTTSTNIPGVDMLMATSIDGLKAAYDREDASYADVDISGFDPENLAYVHTIDEGLRSGALSLALEFRDGSTTTLTGGSPEGSWEIGDIQAPPPVGR